MPVARIFNKSSFPLYSSRQDATKKIIRISGTVKYQRGD